MQKIKIALVRLLLSLAVAIIKSEIPISTNRTISVISNRCEDGSSPGFINAVNHSPDENKVARYQAKPPTANGNAMQPKSKTAFFMSITNNGFRQQKLGVVHKT